MENTPNLLENDLIIDNEGHNHLKEAAMWTKFLSITGFVVSGIIAVMAVVVGSLFNRFSGSYYTRSSGFMTGGVIMVMYLAIAVISFFMSLFLFRFAIQMQTALKTTDQQNLNRSFQNLKIYFRFAGIITLIYLIILVLALIGAVVIAAFSGGG